MKTTIDRNKLIIAFIGTVIVAFFVALLFFGGSAINRTWKNPMYTLSDGWSVTRNGETVPGDSIRSLAMEQVRDDEVWELRTILPREDLPGAALYFRTLQAVVEVTLDGKEIYSYGKDRYAAGKMLKRGICIVPLPPGYMGKDITIRFTATEPLAFNGVAPIIFGTEQDLCNNFLQERRVPLFFGVFLSFYALFQVLVLPYLLFRNRSSLTPFFSALVTLSMGLYILGFHHLIELFTTHAIISTLVEYLSLYMLPTSICMYLYSLLDGTLKRVYLFFIRLDLVLMVIVVFLHVSNMVHLTLYLPAFYVITFAEAAPYLAGSVLGFRRMRRAGDEPLEMISSRIVFFGFLFYMICSAMDTVLFTYAKYIGRGGEPSAGIPFFTTGAILFTMATTAHYYLHGIAHVRADATRERLEHRAYTDPLTGLANRIRCEQVMQQLTIDDPFVIISLDLDGLKSVNDSLGHGEGDRLLTTFAETLKKIFGDMELVGRMGGDEFLVILTGAQRTVVNAKLKELERALVNLNLEEHAFRYSVSYGYAGNHETHFGRRVRDIYMLADRRMYDMKRKRKHEQEAEL